MNRNDGDHLLVPIKSPETRANVLEGELYLGETLTGDLQLKMYMWTTIKVSRINRVGLRVQGVHVSQLTDSIPPIFSSQMLSLASYSDIQ